MQLSDLLRTGMSEYTAAMDELKSLFVNIISDCEKMQDDFMSIDILEKKT